MNYNIVNLKYYKQTKTNKQANKNKQTKITIHKPISNVI